MSFLKELIKYEYIVKIEMDQDDINRFNENEKVHKNYGSKVWTREFDHKLINIRACRECTSSRLFSLTMDNFSEIQISFGKGIWQWYFDFDLKFIDMLYWKWLFLRNS